MLRGGCWVYEGDRGMCVTHAWKSAGVGQSECVDGLEDAGQEDVRSMRLKNFICGGGDLQHLYQEELVVTGYYM